MTGAWETFREWMEVVWGLYLWTVEDPVFWVTFLAMALGWGVVCWLLERGS